MGRIILEDGSQYLPVKFRISEFYQQYPKGKIRTSLMRFDRQNNNPGFVESVLIKAEVYRDDATLLAEAYSQRRCEPQEPSFSSARKQSQSEGRCQMPVTAFTVRIWAMIHVRERSCWMMAVFISRRAFGSHGPDGKCHRC